MASQPAASWWVTPSAVSASLAAIQSPRSPPGLSQPAPGTLIADATVPTSPFVTGRSRYVFIIPLDEEESIQSLRLAARDSHQPSTRGWVPWSGRAGRARQPSPHLVGQPLQTGQQERPATIPNRMKNTASIAVTAVLRSNIVARYDLSSGRGGRGDASHLLVLVRVRGGRWHGRIAPPPAHRCPGTADTGRT